MPQDRVDKLVAMLEARQKNKPEAGLKPKLRLITTADLPVRPALLDGISREAHMRRIRLLSRSCELYWMVDQATFHVGNIDHLEDAELVKLHEDMECARARGAAGLPLTDFVHSHADDEQPPMFRTG